ncbi:MAG: zinc-ribbon domain-containing protein [Deltaproteobacteria bacterium]|nr:zinc-ribbon domain-containing protein [Deltaproteobacteria bacterium]
MIVTCPGCSSKYRVRNESVPADGARMRCPKCETLFLAKPPVDGSTSVDDPSSMYQQLAPQGARGNTGNFPAVPQSGAMPAAVPPPPGVGMPQAGPITALFAAVNPGSLPPDGGLTAAPVAPTPSAAQGGTLTLPTAEAPRVRSIPASSPALREATAATGALKRAPQRPTRGGVAASFGALFLARRSF